MYFSYNTIDISHRCLTYSFFILLSLFFSKVFLFTKLYISLTQWENFTVHFKQNTGCSEKISKSKCSKFFSQYNIFLTLVFKIFRRKFAVFLFQSYLIIIKVYKKKSIKRENLLDKEKLRGYITKDILRTQIMLFAI